MIPSPAPLLAPELCALAGRLAWDPAADAGGERLCTLALVGS